MRLNLFTLYLKRSLEHPEYCLQAIGEIFWVFIKVGLKPYLVLAPVGFAMVLAMGALAQLIFYPTLALAVIFVWPLLATLCAFTFFLPCQLFLNLGMALVKPEPALLWLCERRASSIREEKEAIDRAIEQHKAIVLNAVRRASSDSSGPYWELSTQLQTHMLRKQRCWTQMYGTFRWKVDRLLADAESISLLLEDAPSQALLIDIVNLCGSCYRTAENINRAVGEIADRLPELDKVSWQQMLKAKSDLEQAFSSAREQQYRSLGFEEHDRIA
jgi:hypothetical protein